MKNKIFLYPINYKDPVSSHPIKENYRIIENAINDIYSILNNLSKNTNKEYELIMAREGEATIKDAIQKKCSLLGNVLFYKQDIESSSDFERYFSFDGVKITKETNTQNDRVKMITVSSDIESDSVKFFIKTAKKYNTEKSLLTSIFFIDNSIIENIEYIKLVVSNKTDFDEAMLNNISYKAEIDKTISLQKLSFDYSKTSIEIIGSANTKLAQFFCFVVKFKNQTLLQEGLIAFEKIILEDSTGRVIPDEENNKIIVSSGEAIIKGSIVKWDTSLSSDIKNPLLECRLDSVCISEDGSINIVEGVEGDNFLNTPFIPENYIHLANLYLRKNSNKIISYDDKENSYIKDKRTSSNESGNTDSGGSINLNNIILNSDKADETFNINDLSEDIFKNNATMSINKSKNKSSIALSIGDDFYVKGDGRVKMNAIRNIPITPFAITDSYGEGISLPQLVDKDVKHVFSFIELYFVTYFLGTTRAVLLVSYDKGVTEFEVASHKIDDFPVGTVQIKSFEIFVPVVDNKMWIRYEIRDIMSGYNFKIRNSYAKSAVYF